MQRKQIEQQKLQQSAELESKKTQDFGDEAENRATTNETSMNENEQVLRRELLAGNGGASGDLARVNKFTNENYDKTTSKPS